MKCKGLLIYMLLFFCISVQAQNNVVKTNVYQITQGITGIQFEKRLAGKVSWMNELNYIFQYEEDTISHSLIRGVGLNSELRYFPLNILDNAPRNLYIGPSLNFSSIKKDLSKYFEVEDELKAAEYNVTTIGAGITIGVQFIAWNWLAIDLHANPIFDYHILDTEFLSFEENRPDLDYNLDRFGISLGIAF